MAADDDPLWFRVALNLLWLASVGLLVWVVVVTFD